MYEIIQDFNHEIFEEKDGPFVSIYQNTHKIPNDVQQDLLTFKNLLKKVEKSLHENYDGDVAEAVLTPLRELKEVNSFWNTNTSAFALLATQNDFVVFRLNKEVKEKAIVADTFHTKPLIRHFQTRGTFDVLTLDREKFALYFCNQDVCHKVVFEEGIPVTKEEVLGTLDKDEYLSHASYNGAGNQAMYHGHEDNKDIIEKDTERYFRYVDHFINDTYSKPTNRPLVLWALPEHQGVFRKISKNKHLIDEGVNHSDKELTTDKIQEEAWEVVKPVYHKEIEELQNRYQHARSKGLGSDNIQDIGKKTIQGNVEAAIITAERSIPGKLNEVDGTILEGKLDNPRYDDVLDDLAEHITQQGGKVYVLKEDEMPTDTGIAAIYRYK
ncbi:MAG: hypothetical protein UMR38_05355 [Candidatus Izemoplasma sp.]|nr:hypothetical protein [Candidatus Izemoplasma sp.]